MLNPHEPFVKETAGSPHIWAIHGSLWRWRRLIVDLARREFKARYAGSVLGLAWGLLEPLVQFGLYLTVFSYFLGMRLEGRPGMGSFGVYLVSGLVPFLALQETVLRSVGFARSEVGLVRHVNVPLEVLLAGAWLATLARHAVAFALVGIAAVAMGTVAWAHVWLVAVGAVLLVVGSWGLSLILVPAGAYLPDLSQIVATGLTVLFFMTPIVYQASAFPPGARWLLEVNPVVGVVDAFRAGLVGTGVVPARLVISAAVAGLLVTAGSLLFTRRGRAVRDLV